MTADRSALRVKWDGCKRAEWERYEDRPSFCPLEQSWVYGDAYARRAGSTVQRAVIYDGEKPVAIAQIFHRQFAGVIKLTQILRGPVLLVNGTALPQTAAIFETLRNEMRGISRQILFWTPDLEADESAIATMRQCRLRRILTGHGTVMLDLAQDEESLRAGLHAKWRNALVNAEAQKLRLESASGGFAIPWMLERYEALQREKRFGGPDPVMLAHILSGAAARNILLLRAFEKNDPIAGALFLRHGQGATYLAGWVGDSGRTRNAGTLLLWQGMLDLKKHGVGCLDLGGIETDKAPGIARFKLGTGGLPYRLAGTFA